MYLSVSTFLIDIDQIHTWMQRMSYAIFARNVFFRSKSRPPVRKKSSDEFKAMHAIIRQ